MQRVDDDQDNRLTSIESYDSSMYMIVENRLRNIQQRTHEIMKFVHAIHDDILF